MEQHLRAVVARCDDPPLIDQLHPADVSTPCGDAAIARAALAWLRSKQADVISRDLEADLAEGDWLVRHRIREASADVRGDTDWVRLYDVIQARRVAA